jgi:DNA ligase-1
LTSFAAVAASFEELEKTSGRTAMVRILATLFRELTREEIRPVVYLLQGQLGPSYDSPQFGVSEKLTARALARAFDTTSEEIEQRYRSAGDFGIVAQAQLAGIRRRSTLTVAAVFDGLHDLATTTGAGSIDAKVRKLAAMVSRATALESRYLVRIPLGTLRLGVGEPTILDAISEARANDRSWRAPLERAYNLSSDLGLVAETAWTRGLRGLAAFRVQVGRPVQMQFAERAKSTEEIVRRMGVCASEPKYDGFRCQVHRAGRRVRVFSRNQEDTTGMFPELVAAAKSEVTADRAIFEGEALAYDEASDEFHPFQVTVQRKRKHDIGRMQVEYPLRLNVFDVLYVDGADLTGKPYRERRRQLERLIRRGKTLTPAPALVSGDPAEIDRFFSEQIASGLEGIVSKKLDSPYEAGKRNFNWIKLKRAYRGMLNDTVDLAIVGYFAGRGQRARLGIGAVLGAVYDKTTDRFKTLAKVASGLSDAEWIALRQRLHKLQIPKSSPRVVSRITPAVWVEPTLVVEVFADELTRSPNHTAGQDDSGFGYAMRFPRIVNPRHEPDGVRSDKDAGDATSEQEIVRLFSLQRQPRATR